ncbi:type II CAAX prenyl endopeptidase Rce1 family protein, partial [Lysinibacillus sp. D4B1_S16]|uniref:CPBP family glutamic-type intramembrane protease n=1 Tax=Lysinibacillus sp. D4B1_S16 TaxID=2941231 RepID=UPI0020C0C7AA
TAVLIYSLLFGITHALQLLGGQSLEDTIIQIIYALLVGFVLSLLILDGQSIIITILFHGFNNFFRFMGNVESPTLSG